MHFWKNIFNFYRRNKLQTNYSESTNITSKGTMNIQSFAFFDLETTGLPYQEHNKTKVTEMCINVVQMEHLRLGVFPRVQNKLNLCFNPGRMIQSVSEEITGLSNVLLENQPSFTKDTTQMIKRFLDLQKLPICLVAHNGYGFDFPILKAEMHKAGDALPDDIYCIDTLVMFRDLHKKQTEEMIKEEKVEKENLKVEQNTPKKNVPVELCDGFDELLVASCEQYEKSIQEMNERTPQKQKVLLSDNNVNIEDLYFNPNTSNSSSNNGCLKKQPACRKQLIKERVSFKLSDIYERVMKKSAQNAHRAEDDCNMLIECAATLNEEFVDWANKNAKLLCDIPMMKPGKKIGT